VTTLPPKQVTEALQRLCETGSAQRLDALGVRWVFFGTTEIQNEGEADRSCRNGSAELRRVSLGNGGDPGPWLLHVEAHPSPAVTSMDRIGDRRMAG
jgi:hypothetical protein